MRQRVLCAFVISVAGLSAIAQEARRPSARLVSASRITFPGMVDSNTPILRDRVDGVPQLFAITSFGGTPSLSIGNSLETLPPATPVRFEPHPGHGVWMESIVHSDDDIWYGFYHQERPAEECGRDDRFIPRLAAARSSDQGRTWEPLGVVLEMPAASHACRSTNRFVLGGVGDVSVMLDDDRQDLYLFYSQYVGDARRQGVGVARLAWADRDAPTGKVSVWQDAAWIPAQESSDAVTGEVSWEYPIATPLVAPRQPFHDGNSNADVYWGPAVHWNTYLEHYVMLVNRARDETFNMDGIYVSYAKQLDDPQGWSQPAKLANGGGWYAQVVGVEADGTDRRAGQRARFFQTGRSEFIVEFSR
jgi:hypothetical protein